MKLEFATVNSDEDPWEDVQNRDEVEQEQDVQGHVSVVQHW